MSFEQSNQLPSLSTSLLDRIQQMQPNAWSRMVDVFNPIVYRWARQAGLSGSDAADVVQDVFIAIAKRIGSFERQRTQGSFRSWLATITRNRIRDSFRKQQRLPEAVGGTAALNRLNDLESPSIPTEDELDKSISVASLDAYLPEQVLQIVKADCDQRTWQAFWLTTVMGDTAKDVADRLEMNVASVYQAKSRILRRLRQRLDELP